MPCVLLADFTTEAEGIVEINLPEPAKYFLNVACVAPANTAFPSSTVRPQFASDTSYHNLSGYWSGGTRTDITHMSATWENLHGYWNVNWSDASTNASTNGGMYGNIRGGYSRSFLQTSDRPIIKIRIATQIPAGVRFIVRGC